MVIEENIRTGYKRARLIGTRDSVILNLQETLDEIKEYRKKDIKSKAPKAGIGDGWKVEIPKR